MKTHELKAWLEQFRAVVFREKTFELRVNDRDFQVGDALCLKEFDPQQQEYSGKQFWVYVSHILHGGQFGMPENMCIMSINDKPVAHQLAAQQITAPDR